MSATLSKLALVGLCASAIAQILANAGVDFLEKTTAIMFLHLCLIVLGALALFGEYLSGQKERIFKFAPCWGRVAWYSLLFYFCLNLIVLILIYEKEGGNLERRNGRPVLIKSGDIVRTLSEEEFSRHRTQIMRTISAGWMTGYFFTWLVCRTKAERELE